FGCQTAPIPGPTALMLLAMQGQPFADAETPAHLQSRRSAAVNYLRGEALEGDDLDHLCWARLALDLYRTEPGVADALPDLERRIHAAWEARAAVNWVKPASVRQALTALALGCAQTNVFHLDAPAAARPTLSAAPAANRHQSLPQRLKSALRGLAIRAAGNL